MARNKIESSVAIPGDDGLPHAPVHITKLAIAKLIHEHLAIILTYAFSHERMLEVIDLKFLGEWEYLHKICFEVAEARADRALIELGTQLRILDDAQRIGDFVRLEFGTVEKPGSPSEKLYFRDLTNKIMHSSSFEWSFSDPAEPTVTCHSSAPERWLRADIRIVSLAGLGGMIGP